MCVDGESFEMFVEDSLTEKAAVSEIETTPTVNVQEHDLVANAVRYRRVPSWNLPGHEDYADIYQQII